MGASSSAASQRPDGRRSIRFTFGVMLAVPAVGIVVLWGLATSLAFGDRLTRHGFTLSSHSATTHRQLAEFALLIAAGLVLLLIGAIVMSSFARRLSRDISDLTAAARRLADEQSPQSARRPHAAGAAAAANGAGVQSADPADGGFWPRTKASEVAEAAQAIATLRQTAAAAAASEAGLRNGLRQVFVSLARRNQSLLQRQLRLIDALEQKASDPAALADLFALDHLTTRMRRHAESLAILSDAAPGRSWREPVPVIDVIRGAMAEVEDYKRVTVLTRAEDAVAGSAVADMIHLMAELIENATLFSPSGTRVEVRAARAANGFAIEIDDRGLGIEPDQLTEINQQLATPPDFDLANADRLGLFVGGKLAARHGVRVSLRPSPYGGTTAIVLMPNSIVVPAVGSTPRPHQEAQPAGRSAGLDLRSTEALAPPDRRSALSPPALSSPGLSSPGPSSPAQASPPLSAPPLSAPALSAPRLPSPAQASLAGPGHPGPTHPPAAEPAAAGFFANPRSAAAQAAAAHPSPAQPMPGQRAPVHPITGRPAAFPAAGAAETAEDQTGAGPLGANTYRGLPRRTRQANLSPHLQDASASGRPAPVSPLPAPVADLEPERARDLAASLQRGWQRGREGGPQPAQDQGAGGQPSAAAPHAEETE